MVMHRNNVLHVVTSSWEAISQLCYAICERFWRHEPFNVLHLGFFQEASLTKMFRLNFPRCEWGHIGATSCTLSRFQRTPSRVHESEFGGHIYTKSKHLRIIVLFGKRHSQKYVSIWFSRCEWGCRRTASGTLSRLHEKPSCFARDAFSGAISTQS